MKRISLSLAVLAVLASLAAPAANAQVTLYGSPGPEQVQLQAWIDASHVPTPNIAVRLYEGNCEEGRPEGQPADRLESPGAEAATVQTCAAFTGEGSHPSATNEAIYIAHMAWHPQYPAWWWHLNLLNELGHVYDIVVGDRDHHRERFSAIFDYNPRWWWPVNAFAAINAEWEKWSMAYAFCGYGASYANAHGLIVSGEYAAFGFAPGLREYTRTCRLLRSL